MKLIYKFFNRKFLIVTIIIIAAFLRFYQLGSNPPSLTWDEASWGYNAYSLGIDGKDEFGRFLPLDYLESFGDFKPPVYAYLDVIPVKILGLNEFSTRFPSALFGILTVLLTYFLVKRIFIGSKLKEHYALFSALFLAVSPWHIMLSRAAFEANVATFILAFGIFLFLKGVQDKSWYLLFAIPTFVISLYTFNTSRIVAPLLVLILCIGFRNRILEIKKEFLLASLLGLIVLLPTFKFLLSSQASLRFKEVNIFTNFGLVENLNQEVANDNNAFWSKIIHNRRFAFSTEYLKHYFDNLSPQFLFINGDGNPKFSAQNVGQMYLWDLIFFISGIFLLFKRKEGNYWIIPLWLILAIIPAATARETPHALRIETTLPTFQILTAYGVVQLMDKVKKNKRVISGLLFFIFFINIIYFLHGYIAHYPKEFSGEWQYGYKESIKYVTSVEKKFDQINITDALGRPYIYYLFYTKANPENYRKISKINRDSFGFVSVESFGKYNFGVDINKKENGKRILYINVPNKVPSDAKKLKTFYLLNLSPALVAYTF